MFSLKYLVQQTELFYVTQVRISHSPKTMDPTFPIMQQNMSPAWYKPTSFKLHLQFVLQDVAYKSGVSRVGQNAGRILEAVRLHSTEAQGATN